MESYVISLEAFVVAQLNKIFSGKQPFPVAKFLLRFGHWLRFTKLSVAPWRWGRCQPLKRWRTCTLWRNRLRREVFSEIVCLYKTFRQNGIRSITWIYSGSFPLYRENTEWTAVYSNSVMWNKSCHGDRHDTMCQLWWDGALCAAKSSTSVWVSDWRMPVNSSLLYGAFLPLKINWNSITVRSKTIRLVYVNKLNQKWEDNIKIKYSSISISDSICSGKYIGNCRTLYSGTVRKWMRDR